MLLDFNPCIGNTSAGNLLLEVMTLMWSVDEYDTTEFTYP